MNKLTKKPGRPDAKKSKEWPVVIYLWVVGLGLAGYVTGEITLSDRPHPYHWLLLLAGVLLGIGVGWLWYRWRGDIKF